MTLSEDKITLSEESEALCDKVLVVHVYVYVVLLQNAYYNMLAIFS